MDHNDDGATDTRYLVQPRGPGTGWVFRIVTPPQLVGVANPWNGSPLGKEIKRGLRTRRLPEARKRRDLLLGEVRSLTFARSGDSAFSLESALAWREELSTARLKADPAKADGIEYALDYDLRAAEARGVPVADLKRFSRVANGEGLPLSVAHAQYVKERSPGASAFKPLAKTTVLNLATAVDHLRAFMADSANTCCLQDVTADHAHRFRHNYLPSRTSPRSPNCMAPKTVAKNVTLLES